MYFKFQPVCITNFNFRIVRTKQATYFVSEGGAAYSCPAQPVVGVAFSQIQNSTSHRSWDTDQKSMVYHRCPAASRCQLAAPVHRTPRCHFQHVLQTMICLSACLSTHTGYGEPINCIGWDVQESVVFTTTILPCKTKQGFCYLLRPLRLSALFPQPKTTAEIGPPLYLASSWQNRQARQGHPWSGRIEWPSCNLSWFLIRRVIEADTAACACTCLTHVSSINPASISQTCTNIFHVSVCWTLEFLCLLRFSC
jgi:hypothetical protein